MRVEVGLDCADLARTEAFWAAALGYERRGSAAQYVALRPADGAPGPHLLLQQVAEPKVTKNRMHLDLVVDDMEGEVERLVGLGATRLRDEPFDEVGHRWVALADPEGNEFCVVAG